MYKGKLDAQRDITGKEVAVTASGVSGASAWSYDGQTGPFYFEEGTYMLPGAKSDNTGTNNFYRSLYFASSKVIPSATEIRPESLSTCCLLRAR